MPARAAGRSSAAMCASTVYDMSKGICGHIKEVWSALTAVIRISNSSYSPLPKARSSISASQPQQLSRDSCLPRQVAPCRRRCIFRSRSCPYCPHRQDVRQGRGRTASPSHAMLGTRSSEMRKVMTAARCYELELLPRILHAGVTADELTRACSSTSRSACVCIPSFESPLAVSLNCPSWRGCTTFLSSPLP